MSLARSRDVAVARMFAHLDIRGRGGLTAVASLDLNNGEVMTVRAGGPGIHSAPRFGPFESFEVLLDHEPARFWTRYSDDIGVLYAEVPRLCVAHHIIRHGGIREMSLETARRTEMEALTVELVLPPYLEGAVLSALAGMEGVQLVGSASHHTTCLPMGV